MLNSQADSYLVDLFALEVVARRWW